MELTFLGEHPLATDAKGNLVSRIATLFVEPRVLVTLPGVHAKQRLDYLAAANQQRHQEGLAPLSAAETARLLESAVDVIVEGRQLLIRPDPGNMPLAFEADELLQQLVSKCQIHFLYARQATVQQAIRERGEYWRISPEPHTPADIARTIAESRIGIGGRPIYYYNAIRGIRYLTVQSFDELAGLADPELRLLLAEIRDYSARRNRRGYREVGFFGADGTFGYRDFAGRDFERLDSGTLRLCHAELAARFAAAVPPAQRCDLPTELNWRNAMFACLTATLDDTDSDDTLQGINPVFFRQIRWLPGGRIDHGELIFDSVFAEREANPHDQKLAGLCDEKVKGFICNYVREFGGLEYVNIGALAPAMRRRARADGHRAYIAEVKHPGASRAALRIIRVQQWGIRQHLDDGDNLLSAIMRAEEYTEYTLDRRLGCWELGMPLPGRIDTRRVTEAYHGPNWQYCGTRIWTTCFERDFIEGEATDKIPPASLRDSRFALAFARLLGQAAAPNLVVGRTTLDGNTIFDSGDEMLILDDDGQPLRLVVADHAGTFSEYERPLIAYAEAYARPVISRLALVDQPEAFADAYVDAFAGQLRQMQSEYRRQRRAFDTLFKHSKQGKGTFSWRWAKVLARLDGTDVIELTRRIRQAIRTVADAGE